MHTQKIGYLEFRYGNNAKRRTVNVGDNIQSIAVRRLLNRLNIERANVVGIDRDSLREYEGEPVKLIMNGCFHDECFPLPPQIQPIFFGFNAETESVITKNKALFQKHQPIGCRDNATKRMFDKHRIAAFVTGCATLTLERREKPVVDGKPVIAFGAGSGVLQQNLLENIPKPILEDARLVYQREPVSAVPLNDGAVKKMDALAQTYLDLYKNEASIVVTPLLHVASPCVAMGIPVVLARRDRDDRFTAIDRLLPVYTPAEFSSIDWTAHAHEVEALKGAMANVAEKLLQGAKPVAGDLAVLSRTFEAAPVLQAPRSSKLGRRFRKIFGRR
ncbi:polysaccharide pyruvyl transferase family protein [Achromobacter sp. NPDC058515]|uniref:polysaccharide pyruvyl transferase family protein n=1 Tax=Achromobacter sp. NPDC058515 TaxID=3346533 RepID=UPI003665272A